MSSPLRPVGPAADDLPAVEPEAPARRQPGVLVEVHLADESYTVRITNRERLHFEKTRARHKEWVDYGQSFAMTFVTWSAAKRAGRTELTFEQWQEVLEDWDEVADAPADPTR